jgi:hypothetical protein
LAGEPSEAYINAGVLALNDFYGPLLKAAPFRDRRLSDRTIQALVDGGVDSPERLLFMTPKQLQDIAGIGMAALAEINAYRSRFLPS